ncbi:inner membrane protein YiaA [Alteromonas sp. H39]|uniref:inner membrane protein YiaA n=1 Tax=Alteromonas sp. H39 TaxID=3389876 RepID=UPI0039E0E143
MTMPTKAFRIAAIGALIVGAGAYCIGLLNAPMALNEKGYYFAILLMALFSAVSLQKTIRDKMEGIKTTAIYLLLCWIATGASIVLLCAGLFNAELLLSEKGFFGMAFTLSLFSAVTVQKNVRDCAGVADNAEAVPATTAEDSIHSDGELPCQQ